MFRKVLSNTKNHLTPLTSLTLFAALIATPAVAGAATTSTTVNSAIGSVISVFTSSGTVTLGLHRSEANTHSPGELVKTTTRSGDGAFSFTWYDNTEQLYINATDGTHVGRSTDNLAS